MTDQTVSGNRYSLLFDEVCFLGTPSGEVCTDFTGGDGGDDSSSSS